MLLGLLVFTNEPTNEMMSHQSLNYALVPDCGFSCTEVSVRYMEKHTKTYLHHMTSEEEMPSENERTHFKVEVMTDFFFCFCFCQMTERADNIVTWQVKPNWSDETAIPLSTKSASSLSSLSFSGGIFFTRRQMCMLGFGGSVLLTPQYSQSKIH